MNGWRKEFRQDNRANNKAARANDPNGEGQGIKNFLEGRKAAKAEAKANHLAAKGAEVVAQGADRDDVRADRKAKRANKKSKR